MAAWTSMGHSAVPVAIDDLLGREHAPPDLAWMGEYLEGKRVMVTGGGGSIGSELCRQICQANPAGLLMLDSGENSLCEIDLEIGERFPDVSRNAQLADIRCAARTREIFAHFRPQIVFHAAAFKHVPLLEAHPREVVLNNIVGTAQVARLALAHHSERFVLISSDKAVNPVSVMGVSKRVAELYMQQLSRVPVHAQTTFSAVRFGNVLGSAGSVLPRFRRQIARGGPVTVTHPGMSRYFMSTPDAVHFLIAAAAMAAGGEIFVLDMGAPIHVMDLARHLITQSGLEPDRDIAIQITGVRPGEKLQEELWTRSEHPQPTANPKIMAIWDHGVPSGVNLDTAIDELRVLAEEGHVQHMMERLRFLVPEFHSQGPA